VARKKKKHEDHVNHEAWAIPYADLMTLLLAFFVVMYAVSVVNEGKYRVMSNSIIEAFNGSSHVIAPMPQTRTSPHNVDPAMAAPQGQPGAATTPVNVPIPAKPQSVRVMDVRQALQDRTEQKNLEVIRDQIQRAMQPLIDKQMVIVRKTTTWLEIELRTDILFPSGVARLSDQANGVLDDMAGILKPFPNPVRIEGYTDDRPINTSLYPSNWELSAARAAAVARLFSEQGVEPSRLGIVGWSEYRPAADNTTEDGRNHNRRVLIVILSNDGAPKRLFNDTDGKNQYADAIDERSPAPEVPVALPAVPTLSPAPAEAGRDGVLPTNKVILAGPAPVAQPAASHPALVPTAAAGAITVTAPRLGTPEHGP
jgi:chemotaxis protein MotB